MVMQRTEELGMVASRVLFEHCVDGVLLCTRGGAVTAANPAACGLLDLSIDELLTRSLEDLVDADDPRWALAAAERDRTGFAAAVARIRRGDGRFVELDILVRSFCEEDGELRMCCTLRDITGRVAVEREIEELSARLLQLSRVDDLTGFQNRRGLIAAGTELLQLSDRAATPLQVLYVHVRNIEELNRRLGHHAGDAALQAVARALSVAFRPTDTLARIGGTSFVVLARALDVRGLDLLVGCVRDHLDAPETTAFIGAGVEVSFGSTTRHPGEQVSLEDLVTRADRAATGARRREPGPALQTP